MSDSMTSEQELIGDSDAGLSSKSRHRNRTCLTVGISLIVIGLCLSAGLVAVYLFGRQTINRNYQTNAEDALTLATNGVDQNSDWKPFVQRTEQTDLALVPSGCFRMGYNDPVISDQRPPHEQCFDDPFWINVYEVTNLQFVTFLNAHPNQSQAIREWLSAHDGEISFSSSTGQWLTPPATENLPVIQITWFGAAAYCEWLGGRLPTEAEWEYAARGPDGLIYPWGNDFESDYVVYYGNPGRRSYVGSRPTGQSWVGTMDMSGNVREWVSSIYERYPYDPEDGREEGLSDTSSQRVIRGGTWLGRTTDFLRTTHREKEFPDLGYFDQVGFRCAQDFN